MENYRFQRNNFSKDEIKQAADSNLEIKDLGILSYNTENKLQILEHRANGSNAKYDDLVAAVKLYDNVIKMSKEKRAKVDYESLKSRAKNLYTTLADSLANPENLESVVEAQPAEIVDTNPSEKKGLLSRIGDYFHTVPSRAAGSVRKVYIAAITALALGAGVAVYNYYKPKTAVTESAKSPADKPQQPTKVPEVNPFAEKPATGPAPAATTVDVPKFIDTSTGYEYDCQHCLDDVILAKGPFTGTSQSDSVMPEDSGCEEYRTARARGMSTPLPSTTEAAPVEAPKVPAVAPVTPAPKPAPTPAVEKPAEYVPVSQYIAFQNSSVPYSPQPVVTQPATSGDGNVNLTLKAILHDEAYADPHVVGDSATAKAILDSGNWGLNLYGNGFVDSEHYKDYNVDGTGARFWGGAHMYLPLSGQTLAFVEGNGGYEDRSYTVDFDSGSKLEFGNKGAFVNGKLGLTNGKLDDPENFGVGNKQNFVLLQGTKNWGDATGDFHGDYDAWRASAKGRLMLSPEVSAEAGVSGMNEKYGDSMSQDKITAEGGVRWHTSISGNPAFVELLGVYQALDSEVKGSKSDDVRYGPQVGFGWRLASGDNVTLDATVTGGYLWAQEGDNEWRVMPGVTLYWGKKAK